MSKILFRTFFLLFLLFTFEVLRAQDICSSNPKYCKVLEDTAGVKMIMITLPPGAKLVTHSHDVHITYVLKGGLFKWTYEGTGKTEAYLMKAGESFHADPDKPHHSWNAGKTVIQYIEIVRTQ